MTALITRQARLVSGLQSRESTETCLSQITFIHFPEN